KPPLAPTLQETDHQILVVLEVPVEAAAGDSQLLGQQQHPKVVETTLGNGASGRIQPVVSAELLLLIGFTPALPGDGLIHATILCVDLSLEHALVFVVPYTSVLPTRHSVLSQAVVKTTTTVGGRACPNSARPWPYMFEKR